MMNDTMKMSSKELTQVVGGEDGKSGLCEGSVRRVHGLEPDGLRSAPSPAMTTATRSASFIMMMKSRSSATTPSQSMTLTRPNTQSIHGSTPRDLTRAAG